MLIQISLAVILAVLAVTLRRLLRSRAELDRLVADEIARIWARLEWLCGDTDGRLSVDRVELQQRGMQIKNIQKRVKRIETCLYLDARDAFDDDKGKEAES